MFRGEWWNVPRTKGGFSQVHGPVSVTFNRMKPGKLGINYKGVTTTNAAGHRMWDSTKRRGGPSTAPPLNESEQLLADFLSTTPNF